eukprot:scaffold93405_cov28-Prasinocladus_malaysianus.AAC.4
MRLKTPASGPPYATASGPAYAAGLSPGKPSPAYDGVATRPFAEERMPRAVANVHGGGAGEPRQCGHADCVRRGGGPRGKQARLQSVGRRVSIPLVLDVPKSNARLLDCLHAGTSGHHSNGAS